MALWPSKKKKPDDLQPPEAAAPTPSSPAEPTQLTKLNKQLYAREESSEIKARSESLQQIGIRRETLAEEQASVPAEPVLFTSMKIQQARRRRHMIFSLLIALILGILIIATTVSVIWYRGRQTVTESQMTVTLAGPTEFTAGNELTYTIDYGNHSFVDWQNVEIILEVPHGFHFTKSTPAVQQSTKEYTLAVGNLKAGEQGQVTVTGTLIGEQNVALSAQARLNLTPVNFPSGHFTKTASVTTTITSVPVEVSVDARQTAESGEHVSATVQIRNTSSHPITGAYLRLKPAAGMQLAPTEEGFSEGFSVLDSSWELGTLNPFEVVQRTLIMIPEGQPAERRTLDVEVGLKQGEEDFVQRVLTHVVTLTASELSINQLYNDSAGPLTVKPGDHVKGVIHYANVGTGGLKNVVVTVQFEGEGLQEASLRLPQGAYDPIKHTISWTAASIPALATLQPKQSGDISYEFNMAPITEFTGQNSEGDAKNYTLTAKASIDSPDLFTPGGQPRKVITDQVVLAVGTTLSIDATGFYDDGRLGITSAGPVPPKVGQQTTYTVRVRLGSALNDVGNVRLVAVLPDGVKYTGQKYLTAGQIDFNDRTGEMTWTLPQLAAGTGRISPAAELDFQVAILPAENQINQIITFLNRLQAAGSDLFTNEDVTQQLTTFPSTETASPGKGKVAP